MAAEDAVLTAAHAREEVRRSLDRMEFHLRRGPAGQRGWEREVRFLNALSNQSARLGQTTAHGTPLALGRPGLGDRALGALDGGSRATVGRTKSSLLASFSDDTMLGARQWTYELDGAEWVWVANASACPACLSNHGSHFRGNFIPTHPSCLCYPETLEVAREGGVEALTDDQLLDVMRGSNNPRWRAQADLVDSGQLDVRDAIRLARRPGTERYYRGTLRQQARRAVDDAAATLVDDAAKAAKEPTVVDVPEESDDILARAVDDYQKQLEADDIANPLDLWKTWTNNAFTRVEMGAKKHAKLMQDTIRIMDERIASVNPEFRALWAKISRNITRVETRSVKPGRTAAHFKTNHVPGRQQVLDDRFQTIRELRFNIRTLDTQLLDEYNKAVAAHNEVYRRLGAQSLSHRAEGRIDDAERLLRERRNLVPPAKPKGLYRDYRPEELSHIMTHEMTHALDEATNYTLRRKIVDDGIRDKMRAIAKDADHVHADSYAYGAEMGYQVNSAAAAGGETLAEAVAMYFNGTGHFRTTQPLTAAEWRREFPDIAKWVEDNVLTLTKGDLYQ